jgi:hypothetical protein
VKDKAGDLVKQEEDKIKELKDLMGTSEQRKDLGMEINLLD